MKTPLFYKKKPIFGFDIGHSTIKVVQLEPRKSGRIDVLGYGYNTFPETAITDGVISNIRELASSAYPLITELMVGTVSTNRVAVSIPSSKCFTRVITLPVMEKEDLAEAVRLEADQSIPKSLDDLYIDFEVSKKIKLKKTGEEKLEVVMVAAPRELINSYMKLFEVIGLEVALIETSLMANGRAYVYGHKYTKPLLLVDFGSKSTDINIFDGAVRVTGTISGGGDSMTEAIAKQFKVTTRQAYILKTRYGLKSGAKQKEISKAVAPILDSVVKEINKMLRYYHDRETKGREVGAIVLSGGGANLPGLTDHLTAKTKIRSVVDNPWENLHFGKLQQPHSLESTIYTTAVGLAYSTMEQKL